MSVDPQRPQRQDTYDLRDQIHADGSHMHAHADAALMHQQQAYDDDRSLTEDEDEDQMQMEGEENIQGGEGFIDEEDDDESDLSVPNESIDFDMVYAFHSFAATVEGQANVVKGDSLYLMDDTNSYWWLVRVLKTQEVGYIPAENIETPFERLARLNKHRNVDLSKATEMEEHEQEIIATQNDRPPRHNIQFGNGPYPFPYPSRDATSRNNNRKSIHFNIVRLNHRFIPTLREGEEEDETDEWQVDDYEEIDDDLMAEQMYLQGMATDDVEGMERDGMQWDDTSADMMQDVQLNAPDVSNGIPESLQAAATREAQEYHRQRMQQQQQQQQDQMRQQEITQQRQTQQLQQQQQQQPQQQRQQNQSQVQPAQGTPNEPQREVRSVASRERLAQEAESQGQRPIDPAEVTETRKMTVTPNIAREYDDSNQDSLRSTSSLEEDRLKRLREDDTSDESLKRKLSKSSKDSSSTKLGTPVSSATYGKSPGKLRKEPSGASRSDTEDEGKDGKKKKPSVFGSLFGRGRKDKDKGKDRNGSIGSMESTEYLNRGSEESSRSAPAKSAPESGTLSPTTMVAQQQQQAVSLRNAVAELRATAATDPAATPATPDRSPGAVHQVSEHASVLRERDEKQQNLYKQYLNRSPSSPPEAQPSYGLQSASSMMLSSPSTNSALGPPAARPRPGSLILTSPSGNDPRADLSVIRVFAGRNVQTEATFKTVLLNSSTTASDLVKQAIQRFRLPSGEDANDYYLTVKQVERGDSAVLQPQENPLVVFDTLVVEAMELPKVKRSSVGSISSVSSNLSMHPAIKKLSMNDFTDDSAVKFYLNRRGDDKSLDSVYEGDETLDADISHGDIDILSPKKSPFLTVTSPTGYVPPERFTSPSIRFAVQLVIYAEDLPDDMQFHPQTEAIVLKRTLSDPNTPVLVSPVLRRKIFMFPKNITVAEVTEIGLERFGIQDGVIDGGDEVEDKTTKRRSGVRVRYCLMASVDAQERELGPSTKIIDAFPRAPQYRAPEKQLSGNKRRSLDAANLLGSVEDINPDDPVFVLRRATQYRNSTSRRRSSAPLDEIALQHLHRESTSSSYSSEAQQEASGDGGGRHAPTRAEIIAAQRAATRATQRAIVSAQTNSVRGMDVLLPGNAVLRSARSDASDRIRYSYVEPDGESYDISEIMEQEWRELGLEGATAAGTRGGDLLEGVFIRNKDGIGEKLDRVLHKIRKGKGKERGHSMTLSLASTDSRRLSVRSTSVSEYSVDDERAATPGSPTVLGHGRMVAGGETWPTPATATGNNAPSRPGTTTPTNHARATPTPSPPAVRNPSIAAVLSEQQQGGRGSPASPPANSGGFEARQQQQQQQPLPPPLTSKKPEQRRQLVLPKDDFGISEMMAIIASRAALAQPAESKKPLPPLDPVDAMLFGRPIDYEALHPTVREVYAPAFMQLEEIEKVLDSYINRSAVGAF